MTALLTPEAMAHPTRAAIIREFGVLPPRAKRCPRELAVAVGQPLGTTAYHVRSLAAAGVLADAGQGQIRGAIVHYYRMPAATRRDVIETLAELEALAHKTRMTLEAPR